MSSSQAGATDSKPLKWGKSSFPKLSAFVGLLVAFIALIAISDTDLSLFVLPNYPQNAYAGKVVWITGGSSGIGASLAKDLALAGAQVVISARRLDKLNEVVDSLKTRLSAASRPIPLVLPLDVLDFDEQKKALDNILSTYGKLDVVVLNAGRTQRSLAVNTSIDVTKEIFDLNFISTVNLARITLPHFLQQGSGQMVVVSSVAGKFGVPISSSYAASKFALQGYFDSLRAEVHSHGVHVSTICPGLLYQAT